jgi:hypothetical protein
MFQLSAMLNEEINVNLVVMLSNPKTLPSKQCEPMMSCLELGIWV